MFQKIGEEDLTSMLDCFQPNILKFKKNSHIATAGNSFADLGILLKGEAALIQENAAGYRLSKVLLQPGTLLGEMALFSHNSVWPATVVAQKSCHVLYLPQKKLLEVCANHCQCHRTIIKNILRDISDEVLRLNKKIAYISLKNRRSKICSFLLEQYQNNNSSLTFLLPMRRSELADFLNISRTSISREFCSLKDEGVIEAHRTFIHISNLEALKEMAKS